MINIVLPETTILVICYKNEFSYSSVFNGFSRVSFTTIFIAMSFREGTRGARRNE